MLVFGMKGFVLVALATSLRVVISVRSIMDMDDLALDSEGCSGKCNWAHIAPQSGYGCVTCQRLTGGQAADTRKVELKTPQGEMVDAVVKYADPGEGQDASGLRTEIKVANALMAAHVKAVPRYFTDIVTDDGNPVLAMEWLEGYKDLEKIYPTLSSEDTFTRETRAAAMFHAYVELYMAGVRHCDLHWGQVMFKVDDPTDVKFIDFGKSQSQKTVEDIGCASYGYVNDIGNGGKLWDGLYLGDKFGIKKPLFNGATSFQVPGEQNQYRTFRGAFTCVACAHGKIKPQLGQIDWHANMILNLWRKHHGTPQTADAAHPVHKPSAVQEPHTQQRPQSSEPAQNSKPDQPRAMAGDLRTVLKPCFPLPTKSKSKASICQLNNNDEDKVKSSCEAMVQCGDGTLRRVEISAGFALTSVRNCWNCEVVKAL